MILYVCNGGYDMKILCLVVCIFALSISILLCGCNPKTNDVNNDVTSIESNANTSNVSSQEVSSLDGATSSDNLSSANISSNNTSSNQDVSSEVESVNIGDNVFVDDWDV